MFWQRQGCVGDRNLEGVAGAREGWKVVSKTVNYRGNAGNIIMLGRVQVTPRWEDDPVQRHNGRWWRGCWGRRGIPPPCKYIRRREGRAGRDKYKYVIISDIS